MSADNFEEGLTMLAAKLRTGGVKKLECAGIAAFVLRARRRIAELEAADRVMTCVYCGHAYPHDTPAHGSKLLTEHIAICKKHPLFKANAQIAAADRLAAAVRRRDKANAAYDDCRADIDTDEYALVEDEVEAARLAEFEALSAYEVLRG